MLADFTVDDVSIVWARGIPVDYVWAFGDGVPQSQGGDALTVSGTTVVNFRLRRDRDSVVIATTGTPTGGAIQLTTSAPATGKVGVSSSAALDVAAGRYWHEMTMTVDGHKVSISGSLTVSEGGVTP